MVGKIKALAKARGLTIIQVEQECGIGQKSIYNWDTNVPAVDKVQRVASFFGVTIDDLVGGNDDGDEGQDK